VNNLLMELRPDQLELVRSVVTDFELETVVNRQELQLNLEAHLDNGCYSPATTLALRKLVDDLDTPHGVRQPPLPNTQEMADKFIASKRAASLQPHSIRNYHQVLYQLARAYPTLPTTPEEIEAFMTSKPGATTRLTVYRILSVFYRFASQRFGIPNVMANVQKPRVKLKEPACLTKEQTERLLYATNTGRERALLYLYLGQGLRLSEALRLDINDVGEDSLRIKGKERDESMPLLPEVRDAILKLAGDRAHDEPLFVGQQGRLGRDMAEENIKRLFQRAGVDGVQQSPKILRSTFASMALAAGCDFYIVKRLLRHSGGWDVTHQHYIRLSHEELRNRLERYSPLRLIGQHSDKLLEGKGNYRGKL
jgi:integrase